VLGGTGSIGASVISALRSRRNEVLGLARSESSADSLSLLGAQPVRGDIRWPDEWANVAESVDAVIQVVGDFTADADPIGRNLIATASNRRSKQRAFSGLHLHWGLLALWNDR